MRSSSNSVARFTGRLPRPFLFLLFAFCILVLGIINIRTGYELNISFLYIAPTLAVTWLIGKPAGISISVLSACVWFIVDVLTGHPASHPGYLVWDSLVQMLYYFLMVVLVSQLKSNLQEEKQYATTDFLTGLTNSRKFYQSLEEERSRSARYGHPFTLTYIDLDNFKSVNDSNGHEVGDTVLKAVAKSMRENLRESDIVARLGGDEFGCLFPETDFASAKILLAKISSEVCTLMETQQRHVTCSIGAITFDKPMSTVQEMVTTADSLMYNVKNRGKNNVEHRRWNGALQ